MVETKETIDKIISELEGKNPNVSKSGKMSVNQVMEILLDRNVTPSDNVAEQDMGNSEYSFDMGEVKRWRDKNNQIYSIKLDRSMYSNRPVIGKAVVFVKKVTRKLIRPILYPIFTEQNEFNASVTSSINALYNNELTTQQFILEQKATNATTRELVERVRVLEEKAATISELESRIHTLEEEVQRMNASPYEAINYSKFEQYFRGKKEEISINQSAYIPYFDGKQKVLELGCGRGEFLQLLKDNGIPAKGIDLYDDFVKECISEGLDVQQGDGIEYLKQISDNSVDGIFAAQLIEHLSVTQLTELCHNAYRKLQEGGIIVLETPNPTCLSMYTNAFYIDPSHVKPVHPKFLEYILREAGFEKIEVVYTESSKVGYRLPLLDMKEAENLNDFNNGINLLSDMIFGSQDYAIIATK